MSSLDGRGPAGRTPARPRHACPCCAFITLSEAGEGELCPVCFWEDDGTREASERSELNGMRLGDARRNFRRFGAKDHESRPFVLPARERGRYLRE